MQFKKRRKCFALVMLVVLTFLATDCWASATILSVSTSYSGNHPSLTGFEMKADGTCDNASLNFDVRRWEQLDSDHVFVGFGDEKEYIFFGGPGYLRDALSESINESGVIVNGPAFFAQINGNIINLCISNEFRLGVMYSMAEKEIENAISGAMIPEDEIKVMIAEGVIVAGAYVGVSISFFPAYIATYSGVELVKRQIALNKMQEYADEADEHIKRNIFLWYAGSFGDPDSSQLDLSDDGGIQVLGASIDAGSSFTYPSGGGDDASNSNPNADGDDVHITHHHIRPYNTGSWHERVDINLSPGQSFDLHTQARVENRSSHDLEDVDIDYCVVKDKKDFDIPHSQRKRLDDDQVNIDEGDKENKTMARTRVSISS
ncbi:MAG: hypothetical protein U9O20_03670, partial [Patescibacteria group bacterium]|nr:hypothetical protein [Patescibacteria group bacterium]